MHITLDPLPLPQITRVAHTNTSARYAMEPLATGDGTTLGSALRRVLLAALPGAAVTAIRIAGLDAGAPDIPGVREDVIEVLLNLRRVRVRYEGEGPATLTLDIGEPGAVTASLIVVPPDADVDIVTPDQYLFTLDAGAELHATLTVERGTGYAAVPPDAGGTPDVLSVASLFTPIRRAPYTVAHARIGPITTYDRLVLEIETDGTLTPDAALHRAAAGLVDHFARVAMAIGTGCTLLATAPVAAADAHCPTPAGDTPLASTPSASPPRAYNALRRTGLTTVSDVLDRPTDDLSTIRHVGRHSAAELRDALVRAGALDAAHAATRFADAIGEGDAGTE